MIPALAVATLRAHAGTLLATVLAVTLGVGILGAALVVEDSARPGVAPRLAAAPVLVTPPGTDVDLGVLPAGPVPWSPAEADGLTRELSAVPGAAGAVADRSFYAQAFPAGRPAGNPDDAEGGHGWSSTRLGGLRLVDGAAPRANDEVAVDRALGVPVGAVLPVNLATGRTPMRVAGTVDGQGLYVSDARAAALAPGVRTIGVPGVPDPAAVARVLGGRGTVLTGDDRGAVEPAWLVHQRYLGTQVIAALAVVALFTTVFVVASTLTVSITGRRRELALLRTVGATPRQVRGLVLAEATGLGLVGGAAGALLAVALAPGVAAVLAALDALPAGFALSITPGPLALAAVVGLGVAVLGAGLASRRAARVRPAEALAGEAAAPSAHRVGRTWVGLGAVGLGAALAVTAAVVDSDARMTLALGAGMILVVAGSLLAPEALGPLVRVVTAPLARRGRGATAMLVRAEVLAAPRRAAATAAPVVAAVGFAVLLSGMVTTMNVAYPASQAERVAGQTMVDVDGTPGLTDEVLRAIGPPPGTRASLPTRGVVPGPSGTTGVDVIGSIDRGLVGPGEVVLSDRMAGVLHVAEGAALPVRFADGATVGLRVVRVLPLDPARGEVTTTRAEVRRHDPSALGDEYYVPVGLAVPPVPPGAVARDAQGFVVADYATDATTTRGLVGLLVAVAVGYSGLAVANGMAMSARARRGEHAILGSVGATRSQILRAALAETALVSGVGAALGLLTSVPPLLGVASGLATATETEVGLHLDAATTLAVVSGCVAVAMLASGVVTRGSRPR